MKTLWPVVTLVLLCIEILQPSKESRCPNPTGLNPTLVRIMAIEAKIQQKNTINMVAKSNPPLESPPLTSSTTYRVRTGKERLQVCICTQIFCFFYSKISYKILYSDDFIFAISVRRHNCYGYKCRWKSKREIALNHIKLELLFSRSYIVSLYSCMFIIICSRF